MVRVLAFIITFIIGVSVSCGGKKDVVPNSTGGSTTTGSPNDQTPMGIKLKLTSPLDENIKTEMDASLTKLFSDVQSRGYSRMNSHSDYTITVKDDCVDRFGTMAWLDRLDDYDGQEFDQDPRPGIGMVYRAEQVNIYPNKAPDFIICRDAVQSMKNTTRYGAEHIILYYNDRGEYERTAVHITSGHPIIPEL